MPMSARHARIGGAGFERDPRAERKSCGPERRVRIARVHEVERRAEVFDFADALVERAGAQADAAEIESQHRAADARQAFRALEDGFRVHRAALLRMRVREDDGRARSGDLRVGIEQGLERSRGPPQRDVHITLPDQQRA